MTSAPSYDVLVVGAGPSGLSTAISAARNGARVLVVERHAGTSIFPKATGVRPRSMEILRTWGLEEAVQAGAQPVRLAVAVSATLVDPHQQEITIGAPDPHALARVSPSRFAICPQDHLEPLLLRHLLDRGGHVGFRTELLDAAEDSDGVTARVRSEHGEWTVRSRFVVGADGADSTVRPLCGIDMRHLGSEGEHLATLFRADLAPRIAGHHYALHAVTNAGAEGLFVASGRDGRWLFDREWRPDRGETLADWPHARCADTIRAAAGMPDLQPEILGVFPWSFGAAVAARMRAGRFFLVGDAAHRTTPRGATGMNTGIADGHNLGWKLAWVARGLAGDALLDTYVDERYPVGLHNALASLTPAAERGGDLLAQDFGAAPARDTATAGARAPHAWIQRRGRLMSALDLFDGRLTLLTGPDSAAWRNAAAGAGETGLPIAVLSVGAELFDVAGELTDRYRLGAADAVLVRPDGHVAARLRHTCDVAAELAAGLNASLGRN